MFLACLLKVFAESISKEVCVAFEECQEQSVELGDGEGIAFKRLNEGLDGCFGRDVDFGILGVAQGERDNVDNTGTHSVPEIVDFAFGTEAEGVVWITWCSTKKKPTISSRSAGKAALVAEKERPG